MRILLYSWNANNEQILADNFIKFGFDVIWFQKECRHYTRDMELAMEMIQKIHAEQIEAVVSFNYFPIISMICNTCQIPYYAWVYDCPHFTLYAKQITLPCNHIGIFDREMVRQLENYGVRSAYHVPLSVDVSYFNGIITQASQKERENYQCDISFVGSLYTDAHNYYALLFSDEGEGKNIADAAKKMEVAVRNQCFDYQKDCLRQAVWDGKIDMQTLQDGMELHGLMLGEDYFAKAEDILMAAVLEKKVTVEERRILLTELADRQTSAKWNFRLYTGSDTGMMPNLDAYNYGTVDYHRQMPLIFVGSKINLNISLRSIHSGIPLRVLDIMACGGFVLTNWQPEIGEYFEEGKEIAVFHSLEECIEKIDYYLRHEQERQQIAAAGQKKVQDVFSYRKGIERLMKV